MYTKIPNNILHISPKLIEKKIPNLQEKFSWSMYNFNFSEICVIHFKISNIYVCTFEHPRFKIHSSDSFGRFFHQIIQGIVTELVNDDMANFGGARGRWNALSTEDTYGAAWKI